MAKRFAVPKFITIEDRLAGVLTFRQLFALLGAFLLTFFVFRINQIGGIIVGLFSFSLAILLTFVKFNGKPFMFILPSFFDFLLRSRKFVWQRIETVNYKEISLSEAEKEEGEIPLPLIKKREKATVEDKLAVELKYPEVAPNFREKVVISLKEPLSTQTESINQLVHRHLLNPKNPYRLFPYIKFYRATK